jgi:hypothetical protein
MGKTQPSSIRWPSWRSRSIASTCAVSSGVLCCRCSQPSLRSADIPEANPGETRGDSRGRSGLGSDPPTDRMFGDDVRVPASATASCRVPSRREGARNPGGRSRVEKMVATRVSHEFATSARKSVEPAAREYGTDPRISLITQRF